MHHLFGRLVTSRASGWPRLERGRPRRRKRGLTRATGALAIAMTLGTALPARAIVIDGAFSDWTDQQIIGTDAASDVGAGDVVDWLAAWAKFENSALFLSFSTRSNVDFARNAWRYSILLDTDSVTTTGYRGANGELCAWRRVSDRGRDGL